VRDSLGVCGGEFAPIFITTTAVIVTQAVAAVGAAVIAAASIAPAFGGAATASVTAV